MLETGTVIFFWCVVAVLAVTVVSLILGLILKSESMYGVSMIGGGIIAVCLIVAAFIYFPYDLKYQTWEKKEGVVVSSEYTAEVTTGKYTDNGGLKITLSDGTVGYTDDFRLAKYQRGNAVTMLCKPDFIHNNADRYRCRALTGG